MALSDDKQYEIITDYLRNGDAWSFSFGSSDAEKQKFWNWFSKNASQFTTSDEATPDTNKYSTPSACFTNAQRNAIESEMEYCEGFYKPSGHSHYVHGFNVIDGKVLDYTTLNNGPDNGTEYYGVIIPKHLIEHYNPGISKGQSSSLGDILYRFYLDNS